MARHEGKFEADGSGPIKLADLLELLPQKASDSPAALDMARACYLSSSEGWRDAAKQMGGAFANVGGTAGDGKK